MREEYSYCGPGLQRESSVTKARGIRPIRVSRSRIITLVVGLVVVISVAFAVVKHSEPQAIASVYSQTILAVPLIGQHKDTAMQCNGGVFCAQPGPTWPPHPFPPYTPPTDIDGLDLIYGTADDCPHCSAYCAPASIAMIATYRGLAPPFTNQDDIYDSGKVVGEVAMGDSILTTHAVGMYDGTGALPIEVQVAFLWSVGPYIQHDWTSGTQLTAAQLEQYILLGHPVLWLDHSGWPVNLTYPSETYRSDQGHAKVIIGYDDNDTAETSDDLLLINDPWPEYNHKQILPANALPGPGGTYNPYWLPLPVVNLNDPVDIYLVDTYADIPEFSSVVAPVLAIILAVVIVVRRKRG